MVQGSVAAGEVGAPPNVMGVVAHPSSGSGDVPTGKSVAKGLEKTNNFQPTTSSQERIHRASHEGTRANVCGPHDKSGAQPGAQLAPLVQSVSDPDVAGVVGAPPDAMGVVAHPSSGSGDVPTGKSVAKGLEKMKNSQPTTSALERICHASHEGTGANVHGPHDKSRLNPVHNLLLQFNLSVTQMWLVILQMQWEW